METTAEALVDAYLEQLLKSHGRLAWIGTPPDSEATIAILSLTPLGKISVVYCLTNRIGELIETGSEWWKNVWASCQEPARRIQNEVYRLNSLRRQLFAQNLPFSPQDIEQLLEKAVKEVNPYLGGLIELLLPAVEHLHKEQKLTDSMYASLKSIHGQLKKVSNFGVEQRKFAECLAQIVGLTEVGMPDAGDVWADAARADLAAMSAEKRENWQKLLAHAEAATSAKPSAKWLTEAAKYRNEVGQDFEKRLAVWFGLVCVPPDFDVIGPTHADWETARDNPQRQQEYWAASAAYREKLGQYLGKISEKNITLLKGLAWFAASSESSEMASALGSMTAAAFQTMRERGTWAARAGNAAIWALGQMPNGVGVGPLAALRTKLRDRGALKLIAAAIETAAARAGMTTDALEDLAVPTGGLDADGTRRETFGEAGGATLTLNAQTGRVALTWFGPDGSARKAAPALVKRDFAAQLKALKAAEAELKTALSAQAARFDGFLLDERIWNVADWKSVYLAHPILGNLARRLLWTNGEGVFLGGDAPANFDDAATICLWHPLNAPDAATVGHWRDTLESRQIVQPFKQAHREVYVLTDAERATRVYSNRFAAHVLRQHQFNSLCATRGWKNSLRLMVDDEYPPAVKVLPSHNLRAEFWVEGIGDDYGTDTNEAGTYLRLTTDQVRFYRLDAAENSAHASGGGYSAAWRQTPAEPVPLDQIPPLVLSEILRDIDLFVGVASVGNDPTWADGGPAGRFRAYWQDYAFGDLSQTAQTRRDVLAKLLPRLKIAARCELDGRFLKVKGSLRTYKIHLGSGNILMEPNDQYLCIVPGRTADTGPLFLPFEGDGTLAVILSKAFLLAADDTIADPTITRQIKP